MDEKAETVLQTLLDVRTKYTKLNFDNGPYHVEVFPYHYFEPERILLIKRDLMAEKVMNEEVEAILVELSK